MNVILIYSPGREGEVISLAALFSIKGIPFSAEKAEPPNTQNWKAWIERLREATYSVFLPGHESWDSPFWLWAAGYTAGAHEKSYLHSLEGVHGPFDDFHFLYCATFEELATALFEDHRHWIQRQDQRAAEAELILRDREISITGMIHSIIENNIDDFLLYLRYGYSPNSKDRRGVSLLHHAIRAGQLEIARLLLEKGANPNSVAEDRGNTPLMDAAATSNIEIIKLLMKYQLDLEVESKNGQTALVLAVGCKSEEIVRLLKNLGADPNHKDKLGLDAIGYARVLGLSNILSILQEE